MGPDYTLSQLGLTKPSLLTDHRLVSEPSPLSVIAILGAWLRIIHLFLTLLLYSTVLP
jgi:hypothetical protein